MVNFGDPPEVSSNAENTALRDQHLVSWVRLLIEGVARLDRNFGPPNCYPHTLGLKIHFHSHFLA
jgi:hypothetical protein